MILELLYNLRQLTLMKEVHDKTDAAEKLFLSGKISEALPILVETALTGSTRARYMLAVMYHEGLRVGKNTARVRELLSANISDGDVCSIFFRVRIGLVPKENASNYFFTLTKLADDGDVFAQYELAHYVHKDSGNVSKYMKLAADQNYFLAAYELAVKLYNKKDYAEAREYFEGATKAGHASSMIYLGDIYWNGFGTEIDRRNAVAFYLKARERGVALDRIVLAKLGRAYHFGDGIDKNFTEATKYYDLAFAVGSEDNYILKYLGDMYFTGGHGLVQDLAKTVDYYKKAYSRGICSEEMLMRISIYYNELYAKQALTDIKVMIFASFDENLVEAVKWLRIGVEKNYPQCITALATAYRYGRGVDKDKWQALKYFELAIENGSADGVPERNIGEIIMDNDEGKIFKVMNATRYIFSPATAAIGDYLQEKQVCATAKEWYQKAAAKGDEVAKKWLDENS